MEESLIILDPPLPRPNLARHIRRRRRSRPPRTMHRNPPPPPDFR